MVCAEPTSQSSALTRPSSRFRPASFKYYIRDVPRAEKRTSAKVLFKPGIGPSRAWTFDVAKDGRFVIPRVIEQAGGPITVVVNWSSLLRKKAACAHAGAQ